MSASHVHNPFHKPTFSVDHWLKVDEIWEDHILTSLVCQHNVGTKSQWCDDDGDCYIQAWYDDCGLSLVSQIGGAKFDQSNKLELYTRWHPVMDEPELLTKNAFDYLMNMEGEIEGGVDYER